MYGREVLTVEQVVKGNLNLDCPRDLGALGRQIPGIDSGRSPASIASSSCRCSAS
jgi:hypothetical protein